MALPSTDITGANWNTEFETLRQLIEDGATMDSTDVPVTILPFKFRAVASGTDQERYFTAPMDCYVACIALAATSAAGSTIMTVTLQPSSSIKNLVGQGTAASLPTLTHTFAGTGREDASLSLQKYGMPATYMKRGEEYKIVCSVDATVNWVGGAISLSSFGVRA